MSEGNILEAKVKEEFEVEETMPEFCLKLAEEHAGKGQWIIDVLTEESHSYENFEEETRKIASFFHKHGMRKGDTVIYLTYDLVHIHVFFVGVWRANGIVRASYPEEDEETLFQRVEESRVGWILCDPPAVEMCQSVASRVYWDVEVIVVNGEAPECIPLSQLFEDEGDECPELLIEKSDTAFILCTSGTTGKSKGAVHTHESWIHTMLHSKRFLPLFVDAPNLIISKGTHITGILFPFTGFSSGSRVLVMPTITKQNLFDSVDKFKPAFIWGFPTFLLQLVHDPEAGNYDFSSLKLAASGGAQITPAMEKTMQELPHLEAFVNLYGLTEVVPACMEIDPESEERKKFDDIPPFCLGKVCPGALITIRDPETGEILGPNERGEICVKSSRCFTEYLNNPEATENAFIDGYFKTGDLGYFDNNEFIFLVDRLKEIFKYYNNHISPTELEEVINQHEAVNQVSVFGLVDPEGGGHIPRAVVTVNDADVTPEEILEFANERLADYKKLRGGLFIVEELPRGKTGKITRNLVAELKFED